MRPQRVLGYCRVSTREQADRTSLDTQKAALARYCAEHGYPAPIVRVDVESGSGERAEARTQQRELMADVRKGDLVLVLDQDRWSRDVVHFLSSADEIRKRGGTLTSVVAGGDVELPEDRLMATQRAAFAEYERRRTMARSERGMRYLHDHGFHVYGRAPLGYKILGKKLLVNEDTVEAVRQIFTWCVEGVGVHEIAERFKAHFPGVRGTDHAIMARRLHDRTYLGEAQRDPRDPGSDWIRDRHEAIIDVVTFERAQQALKQRTHGGKRANPNGLGASFLVAGMLRCGHCEHVMSCTRAGHDGTITHDGWYACHYARRGCPAPRGRRDHIDAQIERKAIERMESLRVALSKPSKRAPKAERYVDEVEPIRRARKRVVDAIADGSITNEDARAKLAELDQKERGALVREDEHRRAVQRNRPEARAEWLATVEGIRGAWRRMSVPRKREALEKLVDRVVVRSTRTKRWEHGAWELDVTWSVWE